MKKTNKPVELTDEQVQKANGGMEIVLIKKLKIFDPILRLIYKVKKNPAESNQTDTVISGPIYADDNDKE